MDTDRAGPEAGAQEAAEDYPMRKDLRLRLVGVAREADAGPVAGWDIVIGAGSFVSVYGPRGSLAEHLLRITAGGRRTDRSGVDITIEGKDGVACRREDYPRLISYLPDDIDAFLVNLYVDEEIGFYLENIALPPAQIRARVKEIADTLGIGHLLGRTMTSLSGGQKQLVAIASVTCAETPVLLLEEPLSNLDAENRGLVLDLLKRLSAAGAIVVFSGLDWSSWIAASHRLLVFDRDGPVYDGNPIAEQDAVRLLTAFDDANRETETMVSQRPSSRPVSQQTLIIRDLTFRYAKDAVVLDKANLELPLDCVVGIVGRNGAGKTTLAKIIAGLLRPSAGSVRLDDPKRLLKQPGIAYAFQDPKLQFLTDSVYDEIAFSFQFSAGAGDETQSVRESLDEFGLSASRHEHPLLLNAFMQRQLVLAALLATSPNLLIIDEPTNGLDTGERRLMAQQIRRIFDSGTVVLMISHDETALREIAGRIVSVEGGKIVQKG
jgi:energy-coupling factor transport system ATP-binding protein